MRYCKVVLSVSHWLIEHCIIFCHSGIFLKICSLCQLWKHSESKLISLSVPKKKKPLRWDFLPTQRSRVRTGQDCNFIVISWNYFYQSEGIINEVTFWFLSWEGPRVRSATAHSSIPFIIRRRAMTIILSSVAAACRQKVRKLQPL